MRRIFLPVLAALLLSVIASGAEAATRGCARPANADAVEAAVAARMNAERRQRGRPVLTPSDRLHRAALRMACDMARNGLQSHTGSDGSSFVDRLLDADGCLPGGENIAWGYPDPRGVVEGWMRSPGHRQNILMRGVAHYGIAVAMRNGRPQWVMVVGGRC